MNEDQINRHDAQDSESVRSTSGTSVQSGRFVPSSTMHSFSSRVAPKKATSSSGAGQTPASKKVSWMSRFLDGVATTSLFMLFFGFPLFFLSLTSQGIGFEKQMYFYFWLLIGLVGWVSNGIVSGELQIRRTPLDIPILILWAVTGISCVFSVDKWHSMWGFFGDPSRGFLGMTALVLAYFFIVSHVTLKRFRILLGGMLLSGTLIAIWTVLAFAGIHFLPNALLKYAPLSLFGTMRSLTLFFGMLLPLFILGFFIIFRDFQKKILVFWTMTVLLSIGALFGIYVLFAVYGFTPWFAVLIGVSLLVIYVLARVIQFGDRLDWMPMTLFVIILVFLMLGNQGMALISKNTVILPEVSLDVSSSWEIAKSALKERLIIGSGPATYGYNFSLYKPDGLNAGIQSDFRFYQSGSLFFDILPTLGILGAFFFLILALVFLGVGLVGLSREKERNKPFSLAIWASAIVFFVASFQRPIDGAILIYGVLICSLAIPVLLEESGVTVNAIRLSLKASPRFALALAFTFMVVSAGVAFLFAFLGKVFIADISAGKAGRMVSESGVTDEALSNMGRAIALVPYEGRYFSALGQMYMLAVNNEAAKPENERNLEKIKNLVEQSAVPLVVEATKKMPNDVLVHEISGQVYENVSLLAGSDPTVLAKTSEVYERAMALEPMNPSFPIKLGLIKRVLANREDQKDNRTSLLEDAKRYFQTAIDKKPDSVEAYLNMGLTEEAMENVDAAIESIEKARSRSFNQDISFHLARILQNRGTESDLEKAEKVSLEALKRDEKNVNILLNLGFIYEKKKEKEKAIETYKKLYTIFEGEQFTETKKQIDMLIDNVSNGKGNINAKQTELPETAPPSTPTEIPPAAEEVTNTEQVIPTPNPAETVDPNPNPAP